MVVRRLRRAQRCIGEPRVHRVTLQDAGRDRLLAVRIDPTAHMSLRALASEARRTQLQLSGNAIRNKREHAAALPTWTDEETVDRGLLDATAYRQPQSLFLTECTRDSDRRVRGATRHRCGSAWWLRT